MSHHMTAINLGPNAAFQEVRGDLFRGRDAERRCGASQFHYFKRMCNRRLERMCRTEQWTRHANHAIFLPCGGRIMNLGIQGIALLFACSLVSGCAATWGSSYHVDAEDSSGVVIRYDSILVGIEAIDKHANEICARYHKTAVPKSRRDAAIIPGGSLMEATYSCVP